MTPLEERLRTELRAESEAITPDGIVTLRLPQPSGQARQARRALRRRSTRHWPQWVKPLAAAAAVVAVIVGTIAAVDAIGRPAPLPAAAATYWGAPADYAYQINGTLGNDAISVRSTATGNLLATVRPPRPYNDISLLTAAASGSRFVYAAGRLTKLPGASTWTFDEKAPMGFEMLQVTREGSVRSFPLSMPEAVTSGQLPSIALSPDGSKLALAYTSRAHTAVVQVITLSTGSALRWASPNSSWQPLIQSGGAWTADGRTFGVGQFETEPLQPSEGNPPNAPNAAVTRLFSITAWGTRLAPGKPLMLRSPAGEPLTNGLFITPDGSHLIVPAMASGRQRQGSRWRGELAEYSSRTGTLLSTTAPWGWTWPARGRGAGFPQQVVAWSSRSGDQLIVLQPGSGQGTLGVVSGNTLTPGGTGGLPPAESAAYHTLEYVLRVSPQLAW